MVAAFGSSLDLDGATCRIRSYNYFDSDNMIIVA